MDDARRATRAILLRRQGLVFAAAGEATVDERLLRAFDLELAALGFLPSARLRARLATLGEAALGELTRWLVDVLAADVGGGRPHTPLFRAFPEGVPTDTFDLWMRKVLVHFLQTPGQRCLFCGESGTTHVLDPCRHVVCDRCFDGASYSACPICETPVDPSSPFFKPAPKRSAPKERVIFRLLELGEDLDAAAAALVAALASRKQAMSPADVADLQALVADAGERALAWLPAAIPVRENVAHVFGGLLRGGHDPARVLAAAAPHLRSATDVLRLIAAYSGADPSLQGERRPVHVAPREAPARWWPRLLRLFKGPPPAHVIGVRVPTLVRRFKVGRLARPLRRALLGILEGLDRRARLEDMLRHRSYWVWIGEHLHPHEHARRFPGVAEAFKVVRRRDPEGTPAPRFRGFAGEIEAAISAGDATALVELLRARPGELARRLDLALRLAGDDAAAQESVLGAFAEAAPRCSTPVLLTLHGLLPGRDRPLPIRVYWPKGQVSKGVSAADRRPTLAPAVIARAAAIAEEELLRRLGERPPLKAAVIDDALAQVLVPFNERTASKAAVALPRGSSIAAPPGKRYRLFLHWCEPEVGGQRTDVDLSVAFYDAAWEYKGVCSYYQLTYNVDDAAIARSSGDLRAAPFPKGATEFVDVDREAARAAGLRYAVMVVNNYAGMPFDRLERGFAGLMLRDDLGGHHFDPRTVALRFDLAGANGVYMPMLFDLEEGRIHWLDVYSTGMPAMNNVASSKGAIARICPEMLAYFASGVRPSIRELALLHAAARCEAVLLRGEAERLLVREPGESARDFLGRLRREEGAQPGDGLPGGGAPLFAALFRGDLDLPEGSTCYALFRERVSAPIAAGDLLT
ncbi:MAG: hypothetical protein H6711_33660 [Myxococcales bacterium]|nr:hypothetical protein [Myxococcales bacterium]